MCTYSSIAFFSPFLPHLYHSCPSKYISPYAGNQANPLWLFRWGHANVHFSLLINSTDVLVPRLIVHSLIKPNITRKMAGFTPCMSPTIWHRMLYCSIEVRLTEDSHFMLIPIAIFQSWRRNWSAPRVTTHAPFITALSLIDVITYGYHC